jgi:superfamily II DNA or RNA helicase
MKITIANELVLEEFTEGEAATIKSGLTLINPKWDIASRMNKSLWGVPQKLKYYREEPDKLIVPLGILDSLVQSYPKATLIDNRFRRKRKTGIQFTGKLHDYQEAAVEDMKKHTHGVLTAMTGSGKTVMLNKIICDIGEPFLILVNTIELAHQFIASLVKFTTLQKKDIGFIGDGKREFKSITVALLQTVTSMDRKELAGRWSGVICDEVHIAPAETYYAALSALNCNWKYGASATPQRSDGLDKVIFWVTGPIRHSVPGSALSAVIIKPTYKSIDTNYYFPLFDTSEYQDMISDLSRDSDRNALIIEELKSYPTQQCVLLCQRKEQVEYFRNNIAGAVMLTSDMKKKERMAVMKGLLDGTHRTIVSTFQLFSTGIDLPDLEVLFICAPIKSVVKVKQSAGRLMRVSARIQKKPIIVDFVDKRVELLKYQWYSRHRILRDL